MLFRSHLSLENNTPELAYQAVSEVFHACQIDAITVEVAPRSSLSRAYYVPCV